MKKRAIIYLLILVMFVVICSFGYINTRDKDSNDDLYTKIDKYVAEEMHAGNIPGMSIVIIQNNKNNVSKGLWVRRYK